MNIFETFPKIAFSSEDEKKKFNDYYNSRGYGIYYNVYSALLVLNNDNKISYSSFSDFIRYDKAIRDELYKYLALYEEGLIDKLSYNLTYTGKEVIDHYNYEKLIDEGKIIFDNAEFDMNFFKYCELQLGDIESIISKLNLDDYDIDKLDTIRKLRNIVMHHKILFIDIKAKITEGHLRRRMSLVKNYINVLLDSMDDSYKVSFKKFVNKINDKTKSPIRLAWEES